ncbi:MAG TPA: NAD(P)/FAD-dependent oxidoreductase [Pyrinomonadaceae bacterium]|nr:NAD(P)/FAD-dependent oxidoreductase [Pyrinomonadaceae bacterium]
MLEWDVIVIGGGAAGLFCAIEAGKRGRRVLVLEHSERVGKKISISGGGRCNFTNVFTTPENFLSANPHFCKSALARYTPADFISLVEKHGIVYHEKKLGQLFCNGSSREIIDLLLRECAEAGVEIRCRCQVLSVKKDGQFRIETNQGSFVSASLVIATGGLSIAPLGATDFGYRIARQFGLRIEETRPGLVPFTLSSQMLKRLTKLSGVSLDALVSCGDRDFRENILFTHRGLSGPAILQISSYWKPGTPISINLLPDEDVLEMLMQSQSSAIELVNLLAQHLPRRFAEVWCQLFAASRPLKQYHKSQLEDLARGLHDMQIMPAGTEGFKKAEVTAGGVSTTELSSQTMEAKRVPGLYFIGEVVDVTGQLGGYNFQWAWASGYAAGQVV